MSRGGLMFCRLRVGENPEAIAEVREITVEVRETVAEVREIMGEVNGGAGDVRICCVDGNNECR
ncbi:MAG: hypothetical protein GX629_11430 [Phycisphaerae bacterium]|nr:hypothetical protein [Phycisphaerae bacterium]